MDEYQAIIGEFTQESVEIVAHTIDDLMDLEEHPHPETINRIYRAFHTVKGNSLMLGFQNLARLAHEAEDLLSKIRSGDLEVHEEIIDILLKVLDMFKLVGHSPQAARASVKPYVPKTETSSAPIDSNISANLTLKAVVILEAPKTTFLTNSIRQLRSFASRST